MKKVLIFLLVVIIGGMFQGCKKYYYFNRVFFGPPKNLGKGTVRSYVILDSHDNLTTIGFNFTDSCLFGLSENNENGMANMVILDLPSNVQYRDNSNPGYDHLEIDWNPNGHEPQGIYDLPHFDFHFYLVGMDELSAIVPGPDLIPVEPQYIPKDYVSGVVAVPNMGVHWTDALAPEFHGATFTSTFVYGFYHGDMLFMEPMVTKAFLETQPNIVMDIKQPQEFQKHGSYPAKYRVFHSGHQYYVALDNLRPY